MSPAADLAVPDRPHDLRMAALGAAAWGGGLAAYLVPSQLDRVLLSLLAAAGVVGWRARRSGGAVLGRLLLALGTLLVAAAVAGSAWLRHEAIATNPVAALADQRATASLTGTVVSDPRLVRGQWGDQAFLRLQVEQVVGRGQTLRLGAPVLVMGGPEWLPVELGQQVEAFGRLAPAADPDLAALLTGARPPVRLRGPDLWWEASGAIRASIRQAVAHRPSGQRGLVPALVDGDDAALPTQLVDDFRTTGLTHLTAVSGTNLTLVLGFLVLFARWAGVRGHWLQVIGLLGVVGFVLVARTEPSVLRAAAMGIVGLVSLGSDGRRRGMRALGVAVVGLLLFLPGLAVSAGFALSVCATAGIVLLVPPWQRALERWLPTPLAMAVVVPLAAQIACTPLVAALSGEVSLVAVVANVLAAPAVGPTTVLGLLAGLVGLAWADLGALLGTLAGWCAAWLILVAETGAGFPGAAVPWGSGGLAIVLLVAGCVGLIVVLPRILGRRRLAIPFALVLVVVLLGGAERVRGLVSDWPPDDWVLVACDVGQGDALVLRTGPRAAIVVDTGPEPRSVGRCLDRLHVEHVPVLLLSHFHADHVDGIAGVLDGRRVDRIETTGMLDPGVGVEQVTDAAADADVPIGLAPYPSTRRYGDATLQVLAPELVAPQKGPGDGSAANDASVVLLVETHGLQILLTGDIEPTAQARLARVLPGLEVDVLKVPHHGSRYQDVDWLTSLAAEVAIVCVGEGNDYGHPDDELLAALAASGSDIARTDEDGAIAVVATADGAELVSERR